MEYRKLGNPDLEVSALRLQAGMVIDQYKNNIENTSAYNSTRFIT